MNLDNLTAREIIQAYCAFAILVSLGLALLGRWWFGRRDDDAGK